LPIQELSQNPYWRECHIAAGHRDRPLTSPRHEAPVFESYPKVGQGFLMNTVRPSSVDTLMPFARKQRPTPHAGKHQARQAQALAEKAQRFAQALATRDYATACAAAEAALALAPRHMGVLSDYAFCLMRLQRFEDAHGVYLRIYRCAEPLQAQAGATWLDGLTELCGWMGRVDDVRRYGLQSLERADARQRSRPRVALPAAPPAFRPQYPERNVIAYTLFGASPRYCEPAVLNTRLARELFPHWRCRVYLDDSVPVTVRRRLEAGGAQVVDMSGARHAGVHPLMWRFLVADDPVVERFLVRDADALLSEREQAAVEEWVASPYWFHHMRDYFTHTELLLAGLWGGCRGGLPDLEPLMRRWLARQTDVTRFADQIFLRETVWPTLRQSVLQHDDLFGFHGASPFPAHPPHRWGDQPFHVGSNASTQGVRGKSTKADGALQDWQVIDPQGREICTYASSVTQGSWQADLPFFLADPLSRGEWSVITPETHPDAWVRTG
jgi:hypothetical protein